VYQSDGGTLFIQIANIYSSLLFHPRPIIKAAAQLFLYFHLEEISINPQTPKDDYLMFRQPNFIPHLFTPISARRGVLLQLG
jgi:hypothetical protein